MRFVVFGIGKFFSNRKEQLFQLCEDAEIVCFLDNNADEKTLFEGKDVIKPYQLRNIEFDKILLMSRSHLQMRSQLIDLGHLEETIWTWEQFVCEMAHGKFEFFCGESNNAKKKKSILIISTDLGYNGGSIAVVYAAKELLRKYEVMIMAPRGDRKFVREMMSNGISILLCQAIPYLGKEELFLINKFDVILVNVFQMLPVVCQLNGLCPILWWIHESTDVYKDTLEKYSYLLNEKSFNKVNILSVSNIPKAKFNSYFANSIHKILPYGIPDQSIEKTSDKVRERIVFAIIGGVVPNKAQNIFIKAIEIFQRNIPTGLDIEYWIIGRLFENVYCNQICEMSKINDQIKIKGKLVREEIEKAYQEIDVVVCPSYEDSLPIVMTEGMMYGKVCIASDATGTADYIDDGVNGLLCKAGDAKSLASKMQWVIDNMDKLDEMGRNARKTYEEHFTMDKFGERLEAAIQETIEMYGE